VAELIGMIPPIGGDPVGMFSLISALPCLPRSHRS